MLIIHEILVSQSKGTTTLAPPPKPVRRRFKSEDEFPQEFKNYIKYLETELNVPISIVSVGPDREQTIIRKK